ncbi:hypothetical protein PENSPDRAFT_448794 [Peniophora sp. CONT]|nr:hypothetical protein PENSPDRAFT_448794 [Peniophora sp. CONT]
MSRTSGSKKATAASSSKSQGATLDTFFKKSSAPMTSTSTGLRPATARPKKEKGRPPERTSPRLSRKRDEESTATTTTSSSRLDPKKKKVAYVYLPSRSTSRNTRASSPLPPVDSDSLPVPPSRPRLNSSASVMSDLTSIPDSSELSALTSDDERAASPVPEPATLTRGTARKRKMAELPVTPTPTKRKTGRLPSAAKKPRLASPPADDDDDMRLLPSSQSDELEISLGGAMDVDPPADVDPWHVDDDDEGAGPTSSVHFPTSSPHTLHTPNRTQSSQTQTQTQTPPPTAILDSKQKTEMMLKEMRRQASEKAKAEAAQQAAEDEKMLDIDIPDLSESSDECQFAAFDSASNP